MSISSSSTIRVHDRLGSHSEKAGGHRWPRHAPSPRRRPGGRNTNAGGDRGEHGVSGGELAEQNGPPDSSESLDLFDATSPRRSDRFDILDDARFIGAVSRSEPAMHLGGHRSLARSPGRRPMRWPEFVVEIFDDGDGLGDHGLAVDSTGTRRSVTCGGGFPASPPLSCSSSSNRFQMRSSQTRSDQLNSCDWQTSFTMFQNAPSERTQK